MRQELFLVNNHTYGKPRLIKLINACPAHGYESVALIPITVDSRIVGLIHAADHRENPFPVRVIETVEDAAMRLGLSIDSETEKGTRLTISLPCPHQEAGR